MIMIEINTSDFLRMPSSIITFSFLTGSVAFSLGSLSSGISRIMLSSLGSRVNTGGEGIFSIFYKNRIWITSHDFCDICHGRLLKNSYYKFTCIASVDTKSSHASIITSASHMMSSSHRLYRRS